VIEDIGAQLKQLVAVSARDLEFKKHALEKGKLACQEAKATADAVCQAAKEKADAIVVGLEEAVTKAGLVAKEARDAKEAHVQATAHGVMPMEGRRRRIEEEAPKLDNLSVADQAAMQQVIKDAVAACPEGHTRKVKVNVNVKDGVKLTTLVTHDTNKKIGVVSTDTQTFVERALYSA
jgi:hypothetical protein